MKFAIDSLTLLLDPPLYPFIMILKDNYFGYEVIPCSSQEYKNNHNHNYRGGWVKRLYKCNRTKGVLEKLKKNAVYVPLYSSFL